MREKVTKFDLDDAFKALDEIDIPKVKGLRPKQLDEDLRPKKVDRFKALFEEYYDIQNPQEMDEAREAREEEIAQAKLARIEKIVDLDADSPEDIQPSYVGKIIIQCPQCMTMFYKDESDIERSEDDETIVNVGEVCQHCGNEDGYTLIGKVALDEPQEEEHEEEATEAQAEELPATEEETPSEEESKEESSENEEKEPELPSLDDLDLGKEESEKDEEEKKEESFETSNGEVLTESAEEDLDKALEAHNEYIEYLRKELDAAEKELSEAKNDFIKKSVQAKVDALKADLEKALPEDVKEEAAENDLPNADELPEEVIEEKEEKKEEVKESLNEAVLRPNDPKEVELNNKYEAAHAKEVELTQKIARLNIQLVRQRLADGSTKEVPDFSKIPAEKRAEAEQILKEYEAATRESNIALSSLLSYREKRAEDELFFVKESFNEDAKHELEAFVNSLEEKCTDKACRKKEIEECNEDLESENKIEDYIEDLPEACEKCKEKEEIKEDVSDAEFEAMLKNPVFNEGLEEKAEEENCKVCPNCGKEVCECAQQVKEELDEEVKHIFTAEEVRKFDIDELLDNAELIEQQHKDGKIDDKTFEEIKEIASAIIYKQGDDYFYDDAKDFISTWAEVVEDFEDIPESEIEKEALTIPECQGNSWVAELYRELFKASILSETSRLNFYFFKEELNEEVKHITFKAGYGTFAKISDEAKKLNKNFKLLRFALIGEKEVISALEKATNKDVICIAEIRTKKLSQELNQAIDNSKAFKVYVAHRENTVFMKEENENFDDIEDFVEESFNKQATDYLTEVYENVDSFETTNCALQENKLIVEGNINFKSGKVKPTKFVFENIENKLLGSNKDLSEDVNVFTLNYKIKNKALVTESLKYAYRIESTLVENLNK